MSRKSLIICLSVLAVMLLGIGVAIAILYSGTDDEGNAVPDQDRYLLLPAIPADAVLAGCFSNLGDAMGGLLKGFDFPAEVADAAAAGSFNEISSSRVAVSLHYNGELKVLYVVDAGKASVQPSDGVQAFMDFARSGKMAVEYVDCSSAAGGRDILQHSVILVSDSDLLIQSAARHLENGISIMDATGFADASSSVSGNDVVFISNAHSKALMSGMFTRAYAGRYPFIADFADWTAIDLTGCDDTGIYADISAVYSANDPSCFMNVLEKQQPAVPEISGIIPAYTLSAVSLPISDISAYVSAYQAYVDSRQSLYEFRKKQRDLHTRTGVAPVDFFRKLDVREVARADFRLGKETASVNLIRIGRQDSLIFVGTDNKSFEDSSAVIHAWPYSSYVSSVFGRIFELKDESCFTYMNGWIISGSLDAVTHYADDYALEYDLAEYMADAGRSDLLADESVLSAYFSLNAYPQGHKDIFKEPVAKALEPVWKDNDYTPVVLSVSKDRKGTDISLQVQRLAMLKTRAPKNERDTVVIVPAGPFRVKNSGTGKMNLFYQNQHGAICLQEEGGKGLWGVPFKGKLCGTAHNVDYYSNGKLQILFGAGSSIYLIDRLGHYVNGFPVDLGKPILIGPDVYDFNGTNAYNIMVLHKDNTIEMYNLKGRRPSSWKTITGPDKIKSLPERIVVGGNTFWVVRTSIQTLIYPFGGGDPLTSFSGDQMIRPDSEVRTVDERSVSVDCYDGQTRTVVLK